MKEIRKRMIVVLAAFVLGFTVFVLGSFTVEVKADEPQEPKDYEELTVSTAQENEEYTVIPCSISSHSDYNDYKPRVLTGESGERCLNKVKERSEPFNKD